MISAIHPPKCELDGATSLSSSHIAFRLYLTGLFPITFISHRSLSYYIHISEDSHKIHQMSMIYTHLLQNFWAG